MNFAILALGTNKGDKKVNLIRGLELLNSIGKTVKVSSIYETSSLLHDEQDVYFNVVCSFETNLNPMKLLDNIHKIENQMGRDRSVKVWGERIIDIDIIDFNGMVINENNLIIPHKEMIFRSFVLYPLAEIAPNYINPFLKLSVSNMINKLDDDLGIRKVDSF